MQVKRLAWLGTRTERFDETTSFVRDVLGLEPVHVEKGFAMFQLPGGDRDYVEVFDIDHPHAELHTTGPVVGLLVDDVELASQELQVAGAELIGSIQQPPEMDGYGWIYFRGPDGNVYALVQGSRALPD